MTGSRGGSAAAGAELVGTLLSVVRGLVDELTPRAAPRVSLDSLLERDLGLDSLGLVELISRVEQALGVALPDTVLSGARTPRDLLEMIPPDLGQTPALVPLAPEVAPVAPEGALEGGPIAPELAQTLPEALEWHVAREPEALHVI